MSMTARQPQVTTLHELRDAIVREQVRVPNTNIALVYLDLAEDILGREFQGGLYAKTQDAFEARFPADPDEILAVAFGGVQIYRKWRRNILRLLSFAGVSGCQ